ncbi:hypothetical protein T492DRAFT_443837 [Pavlovales sp. CCMP2436]|nr:hypothetical protein T492DRAFT_443837 [Pavlovales sp. CCMP2436]
MTSARRPVGDAFAFPRQPVLRLHDVLDGGIGGTDGSAINAGSAGGGGGNRALSAADALALEWSVLTSAKHAHVPAFALGTVLLCGWRGWHVSASPSVYLFVRTAAILTSRGSSPGGKPASATAIADSAAARPAASSAISAALGALARAGALVATALALLAVSSTVGAWGALGALFGGLAERRSARRAQRRAQAVGQPPLSPAVLAGERTRGTARAFWLGKATRHVRAGAATALLGAVELLWACEAGALALAWVLRSLALAWLPALVLRLSALDYEEVSQELKRSVGSASRALSQLPETVAYRANIAGLQFENLLADSWVRAGRVQRRAGGGEAGGGPFVPWVRGCACAVSGCERPTARSAERGARALRLRIPCPTWRPLLSRRSSRR